jgi:hypothetical protein
METHNLKRLICNHYGLRMNTKIHKYNEFTFTITLGDTLIDLPYPKEYLRDIKIEKLLNG